jgi:hypothetical protein
MDRSISSSFRSSDPAGAPEHGLQDACIAAKQLSSLWNSSKNAKLLRQKPPAAALAGPALEAVRSSNSLLSYLVEAMSTKTDHDELNTMFLSSCFDEYKLPELLVSLLVWLQQRPKALMMMQHEAAAANAGTLQSLSGMWSSCLACLARLAWLLMSRCEQDPRVSDYRLQLIQKADQERVSLQ